MAWTTYPWYGMVFTSPFPLSSGVIDYLGGQEKWGKHRRDTRARRVIPVHAVRGELPGELLMPELNGDMQEALMHLQLLEVSQLAGNLLMPELAE